MKRRNFLATSAGLVAATPAVTVPAHASENASKGDAIGLDFSYTKSGLGKSIPINKSRAYEVLEELELDGLIALRPHNVFYLTNTYTTLTAFKEEYPAFGVFPRDPSQPSFLSHLPQPRL